MARDIQIRYNQRMRFRLLMVLALLAGSLVPRMTAHAGRSKVAPNCRLKGHKLYGKVKVVTALDGRADAAEMIAHALNVQVVENFPNKCGQWEMVDTLPDLKIQFVDALPDLKIRYVTNFPGIR